MSYISLTELQMLSVYDITCYVESSF